MVEKANGMTEEVNGMAQETDGELFLSFAWIWQRPRRETADHLEEIIDLWVEEIKAPPETFAALKAFCDRYPVGEERLNALWAEYIPLFETGKVEAPPYASVYLNEGREVMGEETLAVRAFYAGAGYGIQEERRELPDHLAVELEFLALLARDGQKDKIQTFRKEHLLPFLRAILPRIKGSRRPVYAQAAELLENWQLNS